MTKLTAPNGVALAAVILCLTACYHYVPMELGAVPEGEAVRVYLTREGIEALPQLPADPILSGTLVRRAADHVLLRVSVAERRAGFHTTRIGQNVRIPAIEVVQLERRELDSVGTGLLLAGTVASAATVILLIMSDARRGTEAPLPAPPEIRVPVFSFPAR